MKTLLIYLPTYNRLPQLRVCLGRLLEEVRGFEKDVVIHVSDNGSTDGTAEYLQGLSHPALQSSRNPTNIGLPKNILKAHDLAGLAEYTWAIGDDDAVLVGAIGRLLHATRTYPKADLFFLNTASFDKQKQKELWLQIVQNGYDVKPEWGPTKSTVREDFEGMVSDLFDPAIDAVLFGSLMCYAWRSASVSNRLRPDELSSDFSKPKACYHVALNYLYCLTPSTTAVHLHKPFTVNFWHGGSDWGNQGHDLAVTQGLGIILYEAIRLGYVDASDQAAYFKHYMTIASDSYKRLLGGIDNEFQTRLREFHPQLAELMLRYGVAALQATPRGLSDKLLDLSLRKLSAFARNMLRNVAAL